MYFRYCFTRQTRLYIKYSEFSAPFWNIYQQHNTEMVRGILAEYKIGKLEKLPDSENPPDLQNPYWNEPERHPAIKVNKLAPFNGEPPPSLLTRDFITPNDLHFIRNRLPVPDIKVSLIAFSNCEQKSIVQLRPFINKSLKIHSLRKKLTGVKIPEHMFLVINSRQCLGIPVQCLISRLNRHLSINSDRPSLEPPFKSWTNEDFIPWGRLPVLTGTNQKCSMFPSFTSSLQFKFKFLS